MRKRRIEIVSVTEQRLIIRGQRCVHREWCVGCGKDSWLAVPSAAAELGGVSVRAIYRWVEAGALHFIEEPDSTLLVCLTSLLETRGRAAVEALG